MILYPLFKLRGKADATVTITYALIMAALLAPSLIAWWTGSPRTSTLGTIGFVGVVIVIIEGVTVIVLSRRDAAQGKLNEINRNREGNHR